VYLIFFTTRVLLGAVSFIAGVNKLLSGIAKSRKALADFGVPKWSVAPINTAALPCMELVTACRLLPARSALIGTVSAVPRFAAPRAKSGCDLNGRQRIL